MYSGQVIGIIFDPRHHFGDFKIHLLFCLLKNLIYEDSSLMADQNFVFHCFCVHWIFGLHQTLTQKLGSLFLFFLIKWVSFCTLLFWTELVSVAAMQKLVYDPSRYAFPLPTFEPYVSLLLFYKQMQPNLCDLCHATYTSISYFCDLQFNTARSRPYTRRWRRPCALLVLSALTLAWTVIGLALVTPMVVIFSPVLVPAAIAGLLLAAGFLSSGGFVVAALSVLVWMLQYLAGKQPVGADQLYQVRTAIAGQGRVVSGHYGPGIVGPRICWYCGTVPLQVGLDLWIWWACEGPSWRLL